MEVCLGWSHAENEAAAGRLTKTRAAEILNEVLRRTGQEEIGGGSVRQWLNDWLAGKSKSKAESTLTEYRLTVERFLRSLGAKSDQPIESITAREVMKWRESMVSAGLHATTINNRVKILRQPFASAVDQGVIRINPAGARNVEPLASEATLERGVFSTVDVKRLIEAAPDDWKGAILVGFFTGARLGDVANMTWEAIDRENRTVTFVPQKTARRGAKPKRLVLPLHPEIERWLGERANAAEATGSLFPTLAGRRPGGKGGPGSGCGLSMEFKEVMRKAEVTSGTVYADAVGKGRKVADRSFHSLRHSFNSALANAGVSQEVRQKLTGHSSAEMNALYTHHELEVLRIAVVALPGINGEEKRSG